MKKILFMLALAGMTVSTFAGEEGNPLVLSKA
jgi:hypothetical protein